MSEWCGHGPILEEDIAMTNIALDLVGQATTILNYAGETEGNGRDGDALAFLRFDRDYRNLLLVEQPNGNFGLTMMRQFLFDAYRKPLFEKLQFSSDKHLAAIAEKSLKETRYHLKHSSEWVIRLGDGTEESHARIQDEWRKTVNSVLEEATLKVPTNNWKQEGGRKGMHSEHLGFMLAEMQYMQRAYPNMEW